VSNDLDVAQDYIPYPSETQYIEFIRANHLDMFPKLIDQSQFNRRTRALRFWLSNYAGIGSSKKVERTNILLMDTNQYVLGYKRNKKL